MGTYRYFVQVFQDHAGCYTAVPIEDLVFDLGADAELAAVGDSPAEALSKLRQFLQWKAKIEQWLPEPELQEVTEHRFAVTVRPTRWYQGRAYPGVREMRFQVECFNGEIDRTLRLVAAPRLGLRLTYAAQDPLKPKFQRAAESFFHNISHYRLIRYLPPIHSKVDQITVRVPSWKYNPYAQRAALVQLKSVAVPLDDPSSGRLRFSRAWQRKRQVNELVELLRTEQRCVIVVGEAGSGKTTLIADAVRQAKPPKQRRQPLYWLTSAGRLIAGMKYLGEWEERVQAVIGELEEISGQLCIENLLDLVTTGGRDGHGSIAAFISDYIRSNELSVIAEATPEELASCRQRLPGFVELFQIVLLEPLDRQQAVRILSQLHAELNKKTAIKIKPDVLQTVYDLHARFFGTAAFPGKAVAFLRALIEEAWAAQWDELTQHRTIAAFVAKTGLPEQFLRDDLALDVNEVYETLSAEVIGQPVACRAAADLICTFKAGLTDPKRPIGSLLFCGPTGVGKTQLAKSIAQFCFGQGRDQERLVRLDMSEYALPGSAARLNSSATEYGSGLIEKVRQQPFVVLLFDEIEKAHPEVFDALLGLLDEGRLTDDRGRTGDFRSAMVILTSNLGVANKPAVGFGRSELADFERSVRGFFRPEFFNRLDQVVPFGALDQEHVIQITRLELAGLARREGLAKRHLRLEWHPDLIDHIARQGLDRRYGARFLQRIIEQQLVAPLGVFLTEHTDLDRATISASLGPEQQVLFELL